MSLPAPLLFFFAPFIFNSFCRFQFIPVFSLTLKDFWRRSIDGNYLRSGRQAWETQSHTIFILSPSDRVSGRCLGKTDVTVHTQLSETHQSPFTLTNQMNVVFAQQFEGVGHCLGIRMLRGSAYHIVFMFTDFWAVRVKMLNFGSREGRTRLYWTCFVMLLQSVLDYLNWHSRMNCENRKHAWRNFCLKPSFRVSYRHKHKFHLS